MKKSFWLFGSNLSIVDGEQTAETYDLVEGIFPPGIKTPLHYHTKYTELIYVVDGELTLYTPGEEHILKKGDSYFIPLQMKHTVLNKSENPAVALTIAAPSGFAKLISKIGFEGSPNDPVPEKEHDMHLIEEWLEKMGDKNIGPPGAKP